MIGKTVGSIVSDKKSQDLIAVPASATVSEAVSRMSEKGIGAILIGNPQNAIDGIFTERDLMTRVVNAGRDARTTAIGAVMSAEVRRVEGWTSLEDALSVMVIPDTPMAHEGRAQVTRGLAEAALRVVADAKPGAGA